MGHFIVPDAIHGSVQLSFVSAKIVDTREFQRLRSLKQLGLLQHIYPAANHSVFSHALGAAHLAREWMNLLEKAQPELGITQVDVLCVELAALCVNLGLRPYSRYWGEILELLLGEENLAESLSEAEMSAFIFHRMYNKYEEIRRVFHEVGLGDTQRAVIEQLITRKRVSRRLGGPTVSLGDASGSKFLGIPDSKLFLFDVVRNEKNHMDTSTLDLALRASHTVGLDGGIVSVTGILQASRVVSRNHGEDAGFGGTPKEEQEIVFHKNAAPVIQDLFEFLARLDVPTVERGSFAFVAIGRMFVDAVVASNKHPFISISVEKSLTLAEAATDPEGILKMRDARVFQEIHRSFCEELSSSRDILRRILVRDLYETVALIKLDKGKGAGNTKRKARYYEEWLKKILEEVAPGSGNSVAVNLARMSYCSDGHSSLEHISFFQESDPKFVLFNNQVSGSISPPTTVASVYHVLCRDSRAIEDVKKAVEKLELSLNCRGVIVYPKVKEKGRGGQGLS